MIKPGGFFGLSEHGLGPNGDPVFPLPWADRADICYMIPPGETENLLDQAGFVRIELVGTGSKYVNGYYEIAAKMKADGPSVLGPHVIGGEDIPLRSSNSIQCIEEGRSFPIEVVCFKPG